MKLSLPPDPVDQQVRTGIAGEVEGEPGPVAAVEVRFYRGECRHW